MHKVGEGVLKVTLRLNDDVLICVVEDNGVGREAAAQIRTKTATKEKSMGVNITRERLEIRVDGRPGSVHIEDLQNSEGKAAGTRVTVHIPIEHS
jgi:sensor histidine kinase YesM